MFFSRQRIPILPEWRFRRHLRLPRSTFKKFSSFSQWNVDRTLWSVLFWRNSMIQSQWLEKFTRRLKKKPKDVNLSVEKKWLTKTFSGKSCAWQSRNILKWRKSSKTDSKPICSFRCIDSSRFFCWYAWIVFIHSNSCSCGNHDKFIGCWCVYGLARWSWQWKRWWSCVS